MNGMALAAYEALPLDGLREQARSPRKSKGRKEACSQKMTQLGGKKKIRHKI